MEISGRNSKGHPGFWYGECLFVFFLLKLGNFHILWNSESYLSLCFSWLFFDTTPAGVGVACGATLLLLGGIRSTASPLGLPWPKKSSVLLLSDGVRGSGSSGDMMWKGALLPADMDESLGSLLGLLSTSLVWMGLGCLVTACWVYGKLSYLPELGWPRWATVFSVVFVWSRVIFFP